MRYGIIYNEEIFLYGSPDAIRFNLNPKCVRTAMSRKQSYQNYLFNYVNQSGSDVNKIALHAQRLDFEPLSLKREYKKSTSPKLVPNSELLLQKQEIIDYYLLSNSTYKTALYFNTDRTRIKKLLKVWDVLNNQSKAASIRNLNRYSRKDSLSFREI